MRYAFLIALREYTENARTKGFWISLLMVPILLFLSGMVPIWLEQKATPIRHFVVVDQSGSLAPLIDSNLENSHQQKVLSALKDYARKNAASPQTKPLPDPLKAFNDGTPQALQNFISQGGQEFYLQQLHPLLRPGAPPFKPPRKLFQLAKLPADIDTTKDIETIADALKPYLRGERTIDTAGQASDLSAAILIPRDIDNQVVRPGTQSASGVTPHPIQYWSINASDSTLRDDVERVVNTEVRRREYLARGLDSAAVHQIQQTYAPFASLNPKKEKGREAMNAGDVVRQWAPSGFVYLLWLSIFVVIQMLLNNVVEEKSNRIIEVLLSSVTPGELMMGKLFGIAAVGLTMVGVWLLALFGIVSWKAGPSELAGQILLVLRSSNLLPLFAIYFLLGYLMYAAFILSIGSVCNTIKEAQSYMGILTMILMVPLLTMTYIPKDPNGPLARILSWIPLYAPFTMMNRANADPPLVDLVGTLALLLVTAALALWMTGKIFRIGILRTGQPPKIIEMLKWATRKEA